MDNRKDPEQLLKLAQKEERDKGRGHLKIFFGYAAGVGKTYSMLQAAREEKSGGVDVVAGYVEPHARPETMKLLDGLEQLPMKKVPHHQIMLNEFDLDAALKRKPQLILVDELAHTNADGCRHEKRYQDIEELLNNGIDVYTTVNVQHIESLNDMVASVTEVIVRERIPDWVFDQADQVELVDIEPEELEKRLNEGKIYREKQAFYALKNFFSEENLTALREIALRRCADRVNKISESVKKKTDGSYYTEEHVLVCISPSPTNPKIIRTAARMAGAFHGKFTALYVETADSATMDEEDKRNLRNHVHLAKQLGADVETAYGEDVALQIAEFARLSGISKIVVGRNNAKRKYSFGRQTLTEKLISYAPNMDVYIIPDQETLLKGERKRKKKQNEKEKVKVSDICKTIAMLIVATVIGYLFFLAGFSEANIIIVYILGVLITAVTTSKRIYSLVSSIVSVVIFNFFFTVPKFTLRAYDSGYPATFLIMFLSAFITSSLAVKIKQNARQAAKTAYRTTILLDTSQLLQQAKNRESLISITSGQLLKLLGRPVVFYPAEENKLAEPMIFGQTEEDLSNYVSENEKAVAAWVRKNHKRAGAATSTLSNAACLYMAVQKNQKVYAVVGIALGDTVIESFEESIILSILGECALAMEAEKTAKEKEEAAVLAKNEQLRANLLRSISHDLRTPLTSISGSAGILVANHKALSVEKKEALYEDIYEDSMWLIHLVENLLSVTRIEAGTLALKKNTELMDEIITEALRHVSRKSAQHHISVTNKEEFLLTKIDARLIMQVIINIVDNAIKYTPVGSHIAIVLEKKGDRAVVSISDDGPGIPDQEKTKIFDMFYTATGKSADSRRSMGLGLALCKAIIHAHEGEIIVMDHKPCGTTFQFSLPLEEVTIHE